MAEVTYKPTLVLFEQVSAARLAFYKAVGYRVITERPAFDTGLGLCGKFICSCESSCLNQNPGQL